MPRKILLADDSVTAQNMGKKILADAGYEVITVSNGSAALKKVNELLPEIVVLDVYMPGYSGLEVCKLLRENRQTSEIPILLTVGKLEPFKSEEALKARANAFIVKPFEATELLAVIRKIEDANTKAPAKASKTGKLNPMTRTFAGSTADAPEAQESGIEEKGWKNRLAMPSNKKAEPEPEEAPQEMGTGFRDLTPPAEDESTLRRESAFTADVREAPVPETDSAEPAPALDISPEEIAAIKAAVAVLSGEGDRAPVLNVAAVEGMPRQLAPEPEETPPEETPEKLVSPPISEPAPVEAPVASASHWLAEAVELTQADAAVSLEREMREAQGVPTTAETFNTYSLANFAENAAAQPIEDEPIFSEVAAAEVAASRETRIDAEARLTGEMPATALAASASSNSHANVASSSPVSAIGMAAVVGPPAGFQDLQPVASVAGVGMAPDGGIDNVSSAFVHDSSVPSDPSAPDDEIDSRTKSQMDAAWSNWREIRNTIVTPSLTEELAAVVTQDAAQPANGVGHDPDSIASIVDSVLAEMRPKLLEEIARKLAAKKE